MTLAAERRRAALLALIACGWLLGFGLLGVSATVAHLAPLLLLVAPLVLGRYPAERALLVAARRGRAVRRRPRTSPRPCSQGGSLLPRGGSLLGAALAGRAPPPLPQT